MAGVPGYGAKHGQEKGERGSSTILYKVWGVDDEGDEGAGNPKVIGKMENFLNKIVEANMG